MSAPGSPCRTYGWRSNPRLALTAVVVLAALARAAPVKAAPADDPKIPRLVVQLLDRELYGGLDQAQADAINHELRDLEKFKRLPGVEVEVRASRDDRFDYRLSGLKLENEVDSLTLEARYDGPNGYSDRFAGYFEDPCPRSRLRGSQPCDRASVAERAAGVVADLFHLTLHDARNGLYRPFRVEDCRRKNQGEIVRMKLSPNSVIPTYREPANWFRYRPGILSATAGDDLEPFAVVLRRRSTTSQGYVVFLRQYGAVEHLGPYCPDDSRPPAGARMVLEHWYPGAHLRPREAVRQPIAVNAAPAELWEEP